MYFLYYFVPKGERDFQVTIHEEVASRLFYNWQTGAVELPNAGRKLSFNDVNFDELIDSFTHEILHKYLHENINGFTCERFDNIDKILGRKEYRISSLDKVIDEVPEFHYFIYLE
jgi:hypothetical protein